MNFRYRLMQFMSGRYGPDKLSNAIIILAAVLAVVNIIARNIVLQLIVYSLIFYAFFRMLSRNISARSAENRWFSNITNTIQRKNEFQKQKRADKLHIYKKCPKCKAILRLPRRIGKHRTVCPKCTKEFEVRVRK